MLKTSSSPLLSTLVTTSHRLHSYLFRVLRYPYTLYIRPQNSHQLRFNFSLSPPGINPLKSPPSYWLCFISRLHTPPPNLWLQHNHYLQLIHLPAWPNVLQPQASITFSAVLAAATLFASSSALYSLRGFTKPQPGLTIYFTSVVFFYSSSSRYIQYSVCGTECTSTRNSRLRTQWSSALLHHTPIHQFYFSTSTLLHMSSTAFAEQSAHPQRAFICAHNDP